ncbi:MAG: DUF3108 domain-containing protein [Deltaproteobacteria bacterium]|nr:DUF3108 domain-containing protein [Deltaproteobacteria bacterium]
MHDVFRPAIFLSLVLLFLTGFPTQAADKRPPRPAGVTPAPSQPQTAANLFARGETLSYTALLNQLPAGDAEIRLYKEQQDGREVYRVTGQARTNELIDYLYRLRGTAEGTFTATGLTPVLFRLAYTDNGRPRELAVHYDAKTKTLQGSVKKKDKVTERSVPATEVYDPSTALYLFRSADLTLGKPFQVEVFTGKERYRITAQVIRKEEVQLTSGTRSALRLHPMVFSLDDAPQKNLLPDETTLWVTTDAAHTPLKLESLVPLGQVVVELSQ